MKLDINTPKVTKKKNLEVEDVAIVFSIESDKHPFH